ncbi:protein-L-isoaspartate(D-aspartate) O-methyltransferase [Candidatus Nitrospira bockiana]
MDFTEPRAHMVREQLARRGIADPRVLAAMGRVPRHAFVPEPDRELAYEDCPLRIGQGQTISQPYMVALMVQSLALTGEETVLDVGTGSGYQAAVLGEMTRMVYTIERLPELADEARRRLAALGYRNITVLVGDGSVGLKEYAPFDAIVVAASAPEVPPSLLEQLAEHGRLVIPVGTESGQTLCRVRMVGGLPRFEDLGCCMFVPLIGREGWPVRC